MTDRRCDIIDKLEKSLENAAGIFAALPPGQLNLPVYSDGARWTVKQVLAHLITIEQSMHWLFRNILSGGAGSPPDFDVERYNRTQTAKLDGLGIRELLDRFRSVRQTTIAMVEKMSDDDLDRQGVHAFHGHGTLERFVRWAYEHQQIHEDDVQVALRRA